MSERKTPQSSVDHLLPFSFSFRLPAFLRFLLHADRFAFLYQADSHQKRYRHSLPYEANLRSGPG